MLLEKEGFEVWSAHGFVEAMELCRAHDDFDLVVMGHSMPQKDKTALVRALRSKCNAPLVTIRKAGESPMAGADCSVEAYEGPKVFLDAVKKVLGVKPE